MGFVQLMWRFTLEPTVVKRILGTLFGYFVDIGELALDNYQVDDLRGRCIGKYSFSLKKKKRRYFN